MANFFEVSTNKRIILKNTPNGNKTIRIGGPIETIIIDSITSNNLYLDISGAKPVTIIMKNTNLTADTNLNVIKSTGSKTIFHLIGDNKINGKITDDKYLINVNELVFQGNGTLNITGQGGDQSVNGYSSSINGTNGQKGTNAVFCNNNGQIPYGVNIKGGDGGNGGDGYSGSSARIETVLYGYNGITHNGYSASPGSVGGKGGDAGANGKGSIINPIYSNPKGGNGGDGGRGCD